MQKKLVLIKIKRLLFFSTIFLLCVIYQLSAQKTSFEKQWDSLMNVYQTTKDDSVKAYIAMNFARWKMGDGQNTGDWDAAIKWAASGVYYSKKGNFRYGIRRCNWQLGRCLMLKGNYPEAIKYFTEFLKAALQQNEPYAAIVAHSWINDCYMLLGDYPGALKNIESGIQLVKSANLDEAEYLPGLISKRGDVYVKMNHFQEALLCFEKLLSYDLSDSLGGIHAKLAAAQIGMKNYDAALKNLEIAVQRYPKLLNLKPEIEYKGILGSFLLQIGEAYCKIGLIQKGDESIHSYKEAITYLNKSVPLLKEGAGGKEALMNAYALLSQACGAINDYQNALFYTNLYIHMKDSIYNKITYLKLADLRVKFETEKSTAEMKNREVLEKARNEKLLSDQKLRQEKILADERVASEKAIDGQKLEQEKALAIANEKANYEKSMAVEKVRNEKQQTNNLLLMGLVLVVVSSIFLLLYLRQRHEKKRAVEKTGTIHQMAELELQSLRSQLNPHFMFNSLNSIQTLIMKEQTDRSQSYLSRFARLLRMLLDNADKPFIPLRMEMEFLQLYLSLESLRVPDMQYSVSTDPALNTEQILIPNMILQPYVENAIWHGLSHKEADKQLQIRIFKENGTINYEIEDNGVGRKKAGELKSLFNKRHQSKGMELINKRIELLNKEYSSFIKTQVEDVIKNKEVAGTLVSIKVPLTLNEHSQN
jgi:tetratricopeptide (TPR) repeat protein